MAYEGQPLALVASTPGATPEQPKDMQPWYSQMFAGYLARWLPAYCVPGRSSM